MIKLYEPVWNGSKDVSTHTASLDYNPSDYETKEDAAEGLYQALRVASEKRGQNPDLEVSISEDKLRVSWESGPWEWAIGASFEITGNWGFTEPYYSFDLCFTS